MAKDRHRKSRRTNKAGPNPRAVRRQGTPKPATKKKGGRSG